MRKIERLLLEKAENFHTTMLLSKAFSVFKSIHSRWNYDTIEEEEEVLKMKLLEKRYLDKIRIFHHLRYVITYIERPDRIACEKATDYY